jgi:hypothetical protein
MSGGKQPQRSRIVNLPHEDRELTPVQALSKRDKIQQELLVALGIAAVIRLRGE